MADDHVHQESEGERDGPDDEGREELERHDQDVQRPRNAGGEQRVLEEVRRCLLHAGVDEHDVRDERQDERNADDGGSRDVQARDDAGEVHGEDHEEERGQEREEPLAVLLAEQVVHDVDPDEVQAHLETLWTRPGTSFMRRVPSQKTRTSATTARRRMSMIRLISNGVPANRRSLGKNSSIDGPRKLAVGLGCGVNQQAQSVR